jgi:hypothetical protein
MLVVEVFGDGPGEAQAVEVLVPRPISSRMTSERSVALLRMLAVSVISTMKVDWPRESVVGADAGEDAVDEADGGAVGGDEAADLGQQAIRATWRM